MTTEYDELAELNATIETARIASGPHLPLSLENESLVAWYLALRKFHSARDSHNIAKRMAWSCSTGLTAQILALPDVDIILRTARVDYSWSAR